MSSKRLPRIFEDRVEIVLTRGQVAVVDPEDADLAQLTWTARKGHHSWYAYRVSARPESKIIHLHRVVAQRSGLAIDGLEVDHRDTDGLNCRRGNLRPATKSQNALNKRRHANNTSGFKGVTWHKGNRKWRAQIRIDGRFKCLGLFKSPAAAARTYWNAARVLHGDFARIA